MGLDLSLNGIDGSELAAFRQGVVDNLHKGLSVLARQRCTVIVGSGRFDGAGRVVVVDCRR